MDKFLAKWKRKISKGDSMEPPSAKRRRISCEYGFRESFLNYLKKNANPRLLLKLMQVSKYFWFKEFPFFVVKDIRYENDQWQYRGLKRPLQCEMCSNLFHPIDIEKITKKLWIVESFPIRPDYNLFSTLVSKIAVCNITELVLYDDLSLSELKLLNVNEIKDAFFGGAIITQSNGDIVSVETILQLFPKAKNFCFDFYEAASFSFKPESTKNIIKALKKSRIQSFKLENIPETFDFEAFFEFMHQNPAKRYYLDFSTNISAQYSRELQAAVNNFIENHFEDYTTVLISFFDQDDDSYEKFEEACNRPF
uniref:DUF38 domain-containing protein n=1 Tax=Panagrolaimus davidi TaxID=227884 RepID=A0A914Q3V5_9BILA